MVSTAETLDFTLTFVSSLRTEKEVKIEARDKDWKPLRQRSRFTSAWGSFFYGEAQKSIFSFVVIKNNPDL